MSRSRPLLAAVLGALAVVAGGCGGDDEPAGGGAGSGGAADGAAQSPSGTSSGAGSDGAAGTSSSAGDQPAAGTLTTEASSLQVPWDIALLPGASANAQPSAALVTERDTGAIVKLTPGGEPAELMRVLDVAPSGEGGLLGIAAPPGERDPKRVFVYFTSSRDNRVASVNLETKLVTPIFTGLQKGEIHNGGALEFGPDGKLYVGVGETGDTGLSQDKSSNNGKILRINTDGSVPADNPFPGSPVWSLGHRNVQGLAWDSGGRMWASEFGQNTTDEVNLIQKGHNYGWPIVEGEGDTDGGKFTNPKVTWTPTSSSSPSGAAVSGSTLYVGALAGRKLWAIPLDGATAGTPKALYEGKYGRIRAVAPNPAGGVWFGTSNQDGRGDPAADDDRVFSLAG
jgi:glucose/arabinose dehydrogenase